MEMSQKDFLLLQLLSAKVGIKTVGELEAFKKKTQAKDNEALLKRLALYVAAGETFKE